MKRLTFLVLAFVLALSFSLPSTTVAKAPTPFTAAIYVWVTNPGDMVPVGVGWRTTNEVIQGIVLSSNWGELVGATIVVNHSSNTLIDAEGKILIGHGRATFTVVKGGSTIEGSYRSEISGDLYSFSDVGGWNLVQATGDYKGIQSHGRWNATLTWNGTTYAGFANLTGTYH